MKLLAAIFLIALALILGGALAGPVVERYKADTAHQQALHSLDEQQRAFDLQQYQARQTAAFAGKVATDYGLIVLLFVAGGGVLYVLLDGYHQRRTPLVTPDRYGQLPVSRAALVDGEYKELMYTIALEVARVHQLQAIHQPGQTPTNLHQHVTQATRLPGSAIPEIPHLETSDAPSVQTFSMLLDRGRVGKGNPLMLGYDVAEGSEITGSWLDLYSTAVSGMPGSGKTTSQRFLACQTALHGAKFAICDPHAGAADDSLAATLAPLASAFVCEPASSDKAILEVVRYIADVGRRRIEGKDSDTTPLILWVDELTSLLGRSSVADELAEMLERVAQEYRKRFVFVCASGQIWTAARTTSELRDSFASVLCHRMKRSQARLLLPTDEAEQVERLGTGQAVLWRTSGVTQTIAVPNTTAEDCMRVGQLISGVATLRHTDMPKGSQKVAGNMPADMPKGSQTHANAGLAYSAPGSAEAKRAAQMFMEGADPASIVLALRNVKSSEGKRYQLALAEVLGLVREGMRARV